MTKLFESPLITVSAAELEDPARRSAVLRQIAAVSIEARFDFPPPLGVAEKIGMVAVLESAEVVDTEV